MPGVTWSPPEGHLARMVAAKWAEIEAGWLAAGSGGASGEGWRSGPPEDGRAAWPRPGPCGPTGRAPGLAEAIRAARAGRDGGGPPGGRVPIIAEVKRRSPSAGPIAEGADAVGQARRYETAGAGAISVLADRAFFGGSPDDVAAVAQAVSVPVLFKDIVVDPLQVHLARACGAGAVLLIAAAVPPDELACLLDDAKQAGLDAVVEVHRPEELELAVRLDAPIIGINNRDLATFQVDTAVAERLLAWVPRDRLAIAESGYKTPGQVAAALACGADAVLVGEALMRSPSPEAFIRSVAQALGAGAFGNAGAAAGCGTGRHREAAGGTVAGRGHA